MYTKSSIILESYFQLDLGIASQSNGSNAQYGNLNKYMHLCNMHLILNYNDRHHEQQITPANKSATFAEQMYCLNNINHVHDIIR